MFACLAMAYKDSCGTSELHQLPGVWFQVACQNAKCQICRSPLTLLAKITVTVHRHHWAMVLSLLT